MSAPAPAASVMEQIVALCKRRGFIYPASDIYGGLNGFWDYGPLGTLLKNNIRDSWWRHMVLAPPIGPDGHPIEMLGLDSSIIQNPKAWAASGHVGGFSDPMVDDKETKQRFRADHLWGGWKVKSGAEHDDAWQEVEVTSILNLDAYQPNVTIVANSIGEAAETFLNETTKKLRLEPITGMVEDLFDTGSGTAAIVVRNKKENLQKDVWAIKKIPIDVLNSRPQSIPSPFTHKPGALTQPRQFNLMFQTHVGAVQDEESKTYLRPETAQGIFLNFKNIIDTMRVKVPFGVAQIGKSFRNEVTPRNFIFRSREFEQMEMEFFCHPDEALKWYEFWKAERMKWWRGLGVAESNLKMREHAKDELSHYSKMTVDIEYKWPFTAPDFGELEGIAHRGCFDLTQHQQHSGEKLDYFDQDLQLKLKEQGVGEEEIKAKSRYIPNVIEPASGLTRAVLLLLCEGYTPDANRPSGVYMKFSPAMAPIKAGVFPLVNKEGMPEVAEKLYLDLRQDFVSEYDAKQSIGKRYARMDEIGTPYCITVDGETLQNQTVTVRDRDSATQQRIAIDQVRTFLRDRLAATS